MSLAGRKLWRRFGLGVLAMCVCLAFVAVPQASAQGLFKDKAADKGKKVNKDKTDDKEKTADKEKTGDDDSAETKPASETATSAPDDDGAKPTFYQLPARKLDVWGKMARSEKKLAEGLTGANRVAVNSAIPSEKVSGLVLGGERKAGIIQFSCKRSGGAAVKVASLEVKDGNVNWTWESIQPSGLRLDEFENYIKVSVIEVSKDNTVVARLQMAPEEMELRFGKDLSLKLLEIPVKLTVSELEDGWKKDDDEAADKVTISSENGSIQIALDTKAKTIRAEFKGAQSEDIDALVEKLKDLKKEAQELADEKKKSVKNPPRGLFGDTTDTAIKDNKKQQTETEQELRKLRAKAAAGKQVTAPKCKVRVCYENGAVVYDLKLKS
jgi:hypothetical protein